MRIFRDNVTGKHRYCVLAVKIRTSASRNRGSHNSYNIKRCANA